MPDLLTATNPIVLAVTAVALAGLALVLLLRRRGEDEDAGEVLALLGNGAGIRPAPVDLGAPIEGVFAWRRIRSHARDAEYRRAVETVRNRYAVVSDPMLLPRTLRTTMDRWDIGFRDAMIRVAETDGLR